MRQEDLNSSPYPWVWHLIKVYKGWGGKLTKKKKNHGQKYYLKKGTINPSKSTGNKGGEEASLDLALKNVKTVICHHVDLSLM